MTRIATVIIPAAPHHFDTINRAIESVHRQTVPCDIVPYFDRESRGAGYARNQGARDTETPFITFLDADDTLEPTFMEKCLAAYERGHYVYTGWHTGQGTKIPDATEPFRGEAFHIVTTLLPTKAFNYVGGFDESLPGHEDTDLHLKLRAIGICGKLVPEPLVNYAPGGLRSRTFRQRADYLQIREMVYKRNGGEFAMGCCGTNGAAVPVNMGEQQPGDVLAVALWNGNRTEGSVVNPARVYYGGNGQRMWVNPQDVRAKPGLWQIVPSAADLTPPTEDILKSAGVF